MQVINQYTRGDALLGMLLTNNKVVQDVKVKGSFGSSDHETMNFKILREFNKTELQLWTSELLILAFWGASEVSTGACSRAAVPTGGTTEIENT